MLAVIAILFLVLGAVLVLLLNALDELKTIKKELRTIIMNQEEFDALINEANTKVDDIGTAVEAERQQVADFIAGLPPSVDASALNGVVARLGNISGAISGIFTPPIDGTSDETSGTEG